MAELERARAPARSPSSASFPPRADAFIVDVRGTADAAAELDVSTRRWPKTFSRAPIVARTELDAKQWLRLAESREAEHPRDALGSLTRPPEQGPGHQDGVRILKKAARAADATARMDDFFKRIARLREQYRRRPTFIAMLDKAGFR